MTKTYKFFYIFLAWVIKFIFQIKVIGAENEPEEGAVLVCSNHISATDPVVVGAAMKHQVCYMAKKELFKIPVLSRLIKILGAFPVDRGGKDVGAVKKAIALLKDGKRVGIFPQGTRHPGENPRETALKSGAAMVAAHANADVLPVYIHRKGNTFKLFRRTVIIIGKPMKFSDFGYDPDKNGEYSRIVSTIFDEVCKLGEGFEKCEK